MAYKLNITEHADELVDHLVGYLIDHLKNKGATKHFLDSLDGVYARLEENPFQFPKSRDFYLSTKGYREAVIPQMNYIIIFSIMDDTVDVVGVFHQLESYQSKL